MSQQIIISTLEKKLPYFKKEFHVKRIGLFGSYAQNKQVDNSDIDLIVEFDKPIGLKYFDLLAYLESLLGKKVDVITSEGLRSIRIKQVAKSIKENTVYV